MSRASRARLFVATASLLGALASAACTGDGMAGLDPVDAGGGADGGAADGGSTDGGSTNPPPDAGVVVSDRALCAVVEQVMPKCLACHHEDGSFPNLEYDALRTSLVNVASEGWPGETLVVPGSAATSFFYRKLAGPLSSEEGLKMPTNSELSAAELAIVRTWIDDGASLDCELPAGFDPGAVRYHPEGYGAATPHGTDLRLGTEDCRTCHGDDLRGGAGQSCDSCHEVEDWRTNCTYCHGGTDDDSGAPPRDLDGETLREALRFRAHTEHTSESNHPAYDCDQCHVKPTDVLTEGHTFDDTPGTAEVVFTAGLSPAADYQGSGSCGSLYCHGNGRTTKAYDHTMARPDCDQCHAGPDAGLVALGTMSGDHRRHVVRNMTCNECHAGVVDAAGTVTAPASHVNGTKDVAFTQAGFTRAASGTCTGSCHNERHTAERW